MKEPVITLTLEEYEELRKEHECLEKEHAELQRKYEASLQEYSRQVEEISACTAVIADLRWKLADLTRRLWGKSSEKRHLPEDAGQLSICFESPSDVNDPVAEEQKTAGKSVTSENGYNRFRKSFTKKITPHARKPIDPSLPREEIIIPMPEGLSLEGATKLGEEVSEQYAVSPARFYVKRIIRPKYRLADGRIITAPMPVMAHPHSNASESVLAHIATAKYYDHLPLHRQLDIFEREGIHLSPSTVSNWMMAAAQRLEPIYNELRELVKDSYYVMADETPHPVLESDRPGALHRGYMWNFYLPRFHTPFFEYHKGRGSSGIDTLLAGQVRVVQSDGFAVYDKFDTLPGKLHLCCWAGYVNDAQFCIDNNPVERSIRPLTLNRKNTLFSGSHEAAHAAAIFFSLMGCCRENKVNPKLWMQDVLIRVQEKEREEKNDYTDLLPFNWKG